MEPETMSPAAAGGVSRTFGLAGARVDVVADDPGVLDWLSEFLAPGFEVTPTRERSAVAVLVAPEVDVDAPERAVSPDRLRPFPCFVMERGVIEAIGHEQHGTVWVEDAEWGIRWTFSEATVRLSRMRPDARLRFMLMRTVREAALSQVLCAGGHVQLHASGLVYAGHGIAFAGAKRSGKTTLAARVAADTGAELIANDRVLLTTGQPRCWASGVPTVVRVRADSLRRLPDLFRSVPDVFRPMELTRAEIEALDEVRVEADRSRELLLSPSQWADQVRSTLSRGAPLRSLAFVRVDPQVEEFELEPATAAETERGLREHCFGSPGMRDTPTLFEAMLGHGSVRATAPLPNASGFRAYRLSVGPRMLERSGAASRLIDALLG